MSGGKATSKNGKVYLSLNHKLLPKIECNGKLLWESHWCLNNQVLGDGIMMIGTGTISV